MSQTERIIDQILGEARDRARSIIEQAKMSAEKILDGQRELAQNRAKEEERSIQTTFGIETEIAEGELIEDAKRKAKWLILSEKNQLIAGVFDTVKSKLQDMATSKKYLLGLENLIVEAGVSLNGGELEVVLSEQSSLPLNLERLAEEIGKRTSTRTQLLFSQERSKDLGVIVRTQDGRIFVDSTFQALLRNHEKDLRLVIAEILFGNGSYC